MELNLFAPQGEVAPIYMEFRDNEDFMELGWAGGFNLGKTNALIDSMILAGISYPGAELLLARRYGTALRATTLADLETRHGALFKTAGGSMNKNYGEYRFPPVPDPMNPGAERQSIIRAVGLDEADIEDKMKSRQPFRVFLEEGNEMGDHTHNIALLRARQKVYHRSHKERHRVAILARKWGVDFKTAQAYVGLTDEELERPMQGLVGVRTIWNPEGTEAIWKRYVGVPYPEEGVTLEWANKHIGIREEHTPPEEHQNAEQRYTFRADDICIHKGERRTVARQVGSDVILIPKGNLPEAVVSPRELTLVMQRACYYAWPWMNKSGNKDNHAASFLIPDKELTRKYFAGKIDVKQGLVTPQFNPAPKVGHVTKAPANSALKGHRAIGAVDHGGAHATAALIAVVTHDDRLVVVREYVQANLSASQNAYNIANMVPPDVTVDWYCDPSMFRRAYETDAMTSAVEAYAQAGIILEAAPTKGDEAIDIVKDLLVFKRDLIRDSKKSELYISEACELTIEALSEVTWKDMSIRRDKWHVDVIDALKYLCSAKHARQRGSTDEVVVRGRPMTPAWREPARPRYRTVN